MKTKRLVDIYPPIAILKNLYLNEKDEVIKGAYGASIKILLGLPQLEASDKVIHCEHCTKCRESGSVLLCKDGARVMVVEKDDYCSKGELDYEKYNIS